MTLPHDATCSSTPTGSWSAGASRWPSGSPASSTSRTVVRPVDDAVDTLLDELLPSGGDDDVALLALRCVPTSFALEVEASPPELATVRRRLRTWLEELGAMPSDVANILVAVNEAAANVVEHAYGDELGTLRIDGTAGRDGVVVLGERLGPLARACAIGRTWSRNRMMRQLMDDVVVTPGATDARVPP